MRTNWWAIVGVRAARTCLRDGWTALRYPHAFSVLVLFSITGVMPSVAQPSGANIIAGQVEITTPNAANTVITQSSQKAIINWQSFSVASGGLVQFSQPNSAAITLNRVTGPSTSAIDGAIKANGQVWLINPNGVLFGQGAQIHIAGLLATTSDIANADFLAGNYNFTGSTNATVGNSGAIRAARGGSVVLSGSSVSNTGLIEATAGNVVLGGADAFTVDFAGDHLLSYAVTAPVARETTDANGSTQSAKVSNSGTIRTPGGKVLMTARSAANVADGVVNNSGVVEATSAHMEDGEIVLDAGNGSASDSGSLNASGKGTGETGGMVQILGGAVTVSDDAKIDVSGDAGGGEVLIGGNFHGAGSEPNAQTTKVGSATINANAINTGDGGKVAVWSVSDTQFAGSISAKGGARSGNGGQVETSGHNLHVANNASVNTLAANGVAGSWLLDPDEVVIDTGGAGAANQSFGTTGSVTVAPGTIVAALSSGNVTLEANDDISVLADVNVGNSGSGNTLKLVAGHSIAFFNNSIVEGGVVIDLGQGSIEYSLGTVVLSANDPGAGSGGGTGPANMVLGGVTAKYIDLQLHSNGADGGSIGTITNPFQLGSGQVAVQTNGANVFLSASGVVTIGAAGTDIGVNLKGSDAGQTPGNLTLSATSILQNAGAAGAILASSLNLHSTSNTNADIMLTNSNNQVTGPVTFQSDTDVSFANSLATYLGTSSAGGTFTAVSASDLYIVSGATLTAGAAGNALLLSAANRFINNAGSSAVLLTGGGRFLIYSQNPSNDTFGNLDSHNTAVWDTIYPGAVSVGGNRYVFSYQPVISVSSNSIAKTYGADNTTAVVADYTISGLQGGIANAYLGDTSAVVYSGTPSLISSGASAGASVDGSPYAIDLSAGSFAVTDNYALSLNGVGYLTVTPAFLVYTANPASKTYGSATPVLSGTVTGFVLGETQATATAGTLDFTNTATATSNVGSYGINGSGLTADHGNYVFVQAGSNATALTINPATLTYTANKAGQAYGTNNMVFSGTVTGFVFGQTLQQETTGTTVFTSNTTASSDVGSYAITGSGLTVTSANYVSTIAQAAGNTTALTINPATLTYVANAASQTYGTANTVFSGAVTGFVLGQTQASATAGTLSFNSSATASSNVGSYTITGSGLTANNGDYDFVQDTANAKALTITPATLTYTANPVSRASGTDNPSFSGAVSGFVNGETQSSATSGALSFITSAQTSSPAGSYPIVGGGLSAPNYVFGQAATNLSALTITPPPPLTISNTPPPALTSFLSSNQAAASQPGATVTSFQISNIGAGSQTATNVGTGAGSTGQASSNASGGSDPPSSTDLATDFVVASLEGGPPVSKTRGNSSVLIPGLLHAESGRTQTATTMGNDISWPAWGNAALWQ